jgi:hypothetical protein
LQSVLQERYAGSPYVAILRGEDPPGYRQLEDSLSAFAVVLAARAGTGDGGDMAAGGQPPASQAGFKAGADSAAAGVRLGPGRRAKVEQ